MSFPQGRWCGVKARDPQMARDHKMFGNHWFKGSFYSSLILKKDNVCRKFNKLVL